MFQGRGVAWFPIAARVSVLLPRQSHLDSGFSRGCWWCAPGRGAGWALPGSVPRGLCVPFMHLRNRGGRAAESGSAQEGKSLPQVSAGPACLKNDCSFKIPGMGASSALIPELLYPSKAKNVDRNLRRLVLHRWGKAKAGCKEQTLLLAFSSSLRKGRSSCCLGLVPAGICSEGNASGACSVGLQPGQRSPRQQGTSEEGSGASGPQPRL